MHKVLLLLSLLAPFFHTSDSLAGAELSSVTPGTAASGVSLPVLLEKPDPYLASFDSLAGVSLFIDREDLLRTKGMPLAVSPDPLGDGEEYHYADATVGVEDGLVLYVHVSPQQARDYGLFINGRPINPLTSDLHSVLGAVDYAAEDGNVYMRGSAALKIYRDPQSGAWEGIDLFDEYSS